MTNNRYLKEKMKRFGLDRKWVARWLLVDKSTVDRWVQPRTKKGKQNPTYRPMPNMAVALLSYRLDDEGVSKEC